MIGHRLLPTGIVGNRRPDLLGFAAVVLVALVVRLPFAPIDFGKTADMGILRRWIEASQSEGIANLYRSGVRVNYPPVPLYLLSAAGWIEARIPATSSWRHGERLKNVAIKLPAILADTATAGLVWLVARGKSGRWRLSLALGLSYALNPAVWYVSAYSGQIDSVYTLPLVVAVTSLEGKTLLGASAYAALALATKLQSVSVAPLLLMVTLVRRGIPGLVSGLLASLVLLALLAAPWWLTGHLGDMAAVLPGEPPRIRVSTYNLWYLVRGGQVHMVSSLLQPRALPLSYQFIGIILLAAYLAPILFMARRTRSPALVAAALSLGTFTLLTQMHERYIFPVLALLALAGADRPRLLILYALLSATTFFNLVTIAPFTEALGTNLVAAAEVSFRVALLRRLARGAAAVDIAGLLWLLVELARGEAAPRMELGWSGVPGSDRERQADGV